MAARLPLKEDIPFEANLDKEYQTRYWLYVLDQKKEYGKLTNDILKAVFKMSLETACIGLKVANECEHVDIEIFQIVLDNLRSINSEENIDFLHRVILNYSLQILNKCLGLDEKIKAHYL